MDTILIIDDDESFGESIEIFFKDLGFSTKRATNGQAGVELMEKIHPDIIITDLKMPILDGMEVLQRVKQFDENLPVIMITGFDDMETTIKAMQLGAYDYIEKTFELERIKAVVRRAVESKKLSERLVIVSNETNEYRVDNTLIGKTPEMKEILKRIGKISGTRVNVLVQGESGTGKELISKIVHYIGITHDHPFIAVNCTALSESLLESELFGHVKGSFTGAIRDKKGKFELAGNGTIFLDEISEISPNLQVKLLRVLQEREFEKVGGEISIPMTARVIAASNKNLQELVEKGSFREDLYYRLKVFTIEVPPLRQRREDIPSLVVHFLKKINRELHKTVGKIPFEVMEILQNYEWVGNVRELENTLLQAVVLAKGDVLEKEYILLSRATVSGRNGNMDRSKLSIADVEKEHIKLVLDNCNWDKQQASKVLGIAKTTLYNKIEYYGLNEQ
jgi:two-component system response regulator AtoC